MIFRGGGNVKQNSLGSGIIAFITVICVLWIIGMALDANTPKCIKAGCDNDRASGSSYCYLHKPYSGSSSTKSSHPGYNSTSSSTGSTVSSSTSSKSTETSGTFSSSSSSGKSSLSNTSSSAHSSYDDGYDDIYEDDGYDLDRYYQDDDYADGVDDAMEDLDW